MHLRLRLQQKNWPKVVCFIVSSTLQTEELTSTTTRLAMTTDITSSGMEVMRGDFEDAERSMRSLTERVVLIEADTRAEDALEATKDIAEISEEVGQVQKDLEEGLAELNARVEEVAEVVSCCACVACCMCEIHRLNTANMVCVPVTSSTATCGHMELFFCLHCDRCVNTCESESKNVDAFMHEAASVHFIHSPVYCEPSSE